MDTIVHGTSSRPTKQRGVQALAVVLMLPLQLEHCYLVMLLGHNECVHIARTWVHAQLAAPGAVGRQLSKQRLLLVRVSFQARLS
jgi:hypothetical protein